MPVRRPVVSFVVFSAVALWLVFVGASVWHHAQRSDQPPIYDASTYFQKADNLWHAVAERRWVNPLDLAPTFRPPGTVLMSYPFGFDLDYRGFYVRSILFPAILVCIAVLVAAYRPSLDTRSKVFLGLAGVFLSTMPAFYYFEVSTALPSPSHWGLVDNFLGGLAALAMAAALRSTSKRSIGWVTITAILGVVAATTKPTGFIVMGLVSVAWFAVAGSGLLTGWKIVAERRRNLTFLVVGSLILATVGVAILVVSVRSEYLSEKNLDFGTGAILLMRAEELLTWRVFGAMLRMGTGIPFVLWVVMMGLVIAGCRWHAPQDGGEKALPYSRAQLLLLIAASCAVFAFGLWFWLYSSGGVYQVRYFIPFALIATILGLPVMLRALRNASRLTYAVVCVMMMLPIVNLAALLVAPHPALRWQLVSGVSMISGSGAGERAQATAFVDAVVANGHDVTVYLASMDTAQATFQAVVDYTRIVKPRALLLSLRVPGDNVRPTTYRIEEMIDSDYWVIAPIDRLVGDRLLDQLDITDIDQERQLIQAWAARLTPADGVELVSATPTARILRVIDHTALEAAFDVLRTRHRWRTVFYAANAQNRLTEEEFGTLMTDVKPDLRDIEFGDRFVLRAVEARRDKGETTLRVWWQPRAAMPEQDWVLFVHSIDATGKMVADQYVPLQFNRPLSSLHGRVLYAELQLRTPTEDRDGRLAIGIVRPGVPALTADHGPRDWNGIRLLVTPR